MPKKDRMPGEDQDLVTVIDNRLGQVHLLHLLLQVDELRASERRLQPFKEAPAIFPSEQNLLGLRRRITELQAHEKAVELGLG